jgi:excisionase family DNA binding protein
MSESEMPNPSQANDRIATSVAAAALAVGLSKGTIRKAIREGKLASYLVGRRRVLLIADLMAWVKGE